jgi:hypothetical protein
MSFWEVTKPFLELLGRVTIQFERLCACKHRFKFTEHFSSLSILTKQLYQEAHISPQAQTRQRKMEYKEPTLQEMLLHELANISSVEGKICPACSSRQYGYRSKNSRVSNSANIVHRHIQDVTGTLFILYNILNESLLDRKIVTPDIPVVLRLPLPDSKVYYLHTIIIHQPSHWVCIQYVNTGASGSGYYFYDGLRNKK